MARRLGLRRRHDHGLFSPWLVITIISIIIAIIFSFIAIMLRLARPNINLPNTTNKSQCKMFRERAKLGLLLALFAKSVYFSRFSPVCSLHNTAHVWC